MAQSDVKTISLAEVRAKREAEERCLREREPGFDQIEIPDLDRSLAAMQEHVRKTGNGHHRLLALANLRYARTIPARARR